MNKNIASKSIHHFVHELALPSRKLTDRDEVPAELFKTGGETVLDRMHRLCVAIWESGVVFPYIGSLITEDGECMMEFHTTEGRQLGHYCRKYGKVTAY